MHYKFNGFYEIGGNYKGRVSEEKKQKYLKQSTMEGERETHTI
jgi:hypothetical protein